jgi:carboxyl-terminal processing protease
LLRIGAHLVAELGEAGLRQELSRDHGGELELEVAARDGKLRTVRLRKDSLVDPSVTDARMLVVDQGIAYVALHSFSHATPGEFDAALRDLNAAGMRGLVLDLRGNAGGVLASAVDIARHFLTRGVIVRTEGRLHVATHHAESAQAAYAGLPMVVLIDEGSASASEVLAGALQDHRLAVIVGERSWGKGTVQTLQRFPEQGTLAKITTARYETPSGRVLERSLDPEGRGGIEPDFELSLATAERRSVHERLARVMPDPLARAQLERWESEEGIELMPHFYVDAQLQAAIDLLSGNRPSLRASIAEPSPR